MCSTNFGRTLDCWINIQQITQNSVRLRYSHQYEWLTPVVAEVSDGKNICRQEQSGNLAGCFVFEDLSSDTVYKVKVSINGQSLELEFRTLPEEKSKRLFRVAVFSDTHISTQKVARHGRLHGESISMLRSLMQQAAASADYIIGPGDMADGGRETEFFHLENIIRSVDIPVLAVPGNHDVIHGGDERFLKLFGSTTFLFERDGVQIAGVDTGNGYFNKERNRQIIERIDPGKPVMLFSHFQFFADDWIPDADKVIFDPAESKDMLEKIASFHGIGCIGHKNVATQVKMNNFTQINLPQLTHFPAGYLVIDVYNDEFRLCFEPIPSEILNEYSRLGTEAATYHSHPACKLKSEYRDKYTQFYWNGAVKNGLFV